MEGGIGVFTVEVDGTFPITGAEAAGKLLGAERCGDGAAKSELRNASTMHLANSGPMTRAPSASTCASLLMRARAAE